MSYGIMSELLIESLGGKVTFGDSTHPRGEREFEVTGSLKNPGRYFRHKLAHDAYFHFWGSNEFLRDLPEALDPKLGDNLDLFFDFLEILHELVSMPEMDAASKELSFSRDEGQKQFREMLNPELALYETPLQILSNGYIVEVSNQPVVDLADQALKLVDTDGTPQTIRQPIHDAVASYVKRGSTVSVKKQAVIDLAGALEALRGHVKSNLLTEDERDLFNIANNFAIRHNNSKQKSDYNTEIWYDWMFHVNLAALLTVIRIMRESPPN